MTTYCGPWLDEIPEDAPSGSLWQGFHKSDSRIHAYVIVGNDVLNERDGLGAEWMQKFRRVWPPGSVMPEPRPLAVNRDGCYELQPMGDAEWVSCGYPEVVDSETKGWRFTTYRIATIKILFTPTTDAICYPVDPLPNGAFVPRPWPDQLGEEQP